MAITWITYETGTLGSTVASPDSAAFLTGSSTGTYDATHVLNGSKSLKIVPAASTAGYSRVVTGLNTPQIGITVPFWYTTAKTADEEICRLETSVGAKIITLTWNSSDRFSVTDGTGTVPRLWVHPSTAAPKNQWVIFKMFCSLGTATNNGTVKFVFYDSAGSIIPTASGGLDAPFTSSAATLNLTNIDRLLVGRTGSQTATDARWYDTVGYDISATDILANYGGAPSVSVAATDNLEKIVATPAGGTGPYTYSITQTSGTTTTPASLGSGQWLVAKHATDTLIYSVTTTDSTSQTSPAQTVNILPIPSGVSATWPKKTSGSLPSSTWV